METRCSPDVDKGKSTTAEAPILAQLQGGEADSPPGLMNGT